MVWHKLSRTVPLRFSHGPLMRCGAIPSSCRECGYWSQFTSHHCPFKFHSFQSFQFPYQMYNIVKLWLAMYSIVQLNSIHTNCIYNTAIYIYIYLYTVHINKQYLLSYSIHVHHSVNRSHRRWWDASWAASRRTWVTSWRPLRTSTRTAAAASARPSWRTSWGPGNCVSSCLYHLVTVWFWNDMMW